MLHYYVTDMAARVTPNIQIPVNGLTSDRAEIRTTNFQMQYLLIFYP